MPPALSAELSHLRHRKVSIHFSDVDRSESIPDRIIELQYPDWSAQIGRGSSTDGTAAPQPDNAWYSSKVMSRHHAELKADPRDMIITIQDSGSMHGTFLNGEKVNRQPMHLLQGDTLTFGQHVIRGEDSFYPLKTNVDFEWLGDQEPPTTEVETATNTFTADYSEDSIHSDDDIEFVCESQRQPSVEITRVHCARPSTTSINTSSSLDSDRPGSEHSAPTSSSSMLAEEDKPMDTNTATLLQIVPYTVEDITVPDDLFHYHSDADSNYTSSVNDENEDHLPREDLARLVQEEFENDYPSGSEDIDQDVVVQTFASKQASSCLEVPQSPPLRDPSPSDAALARPPASSAATAKALPFSTISRPQHPPPFTVDPQWSMQSSEQYIKDTQTLMPPPGMFDMSHPYQAPSYSTAATNAPFGYGVNCYDTWAHMKPSLNNYGDQFKRIPSCLPPAQVSTLPLPPTPFPQPGTLASQAVPLPSNPFTTVFCTQSLKRKADEMSDYDDFGSDIDDLSSLRSGATSSSSSPRSMSAPYIPDSPSMTLSHKDRTSSPRWNPESPTITHTQPVIALHKEDEQVLEAAIVSSPDTTQSLDVVNIMTPDTDTSVVPSTTSATSPRKKVKYGYPDVDRSSSGSMLGTAMRYAAVAVVGASAGAIGTILTLANLPPDYFV